MRFFNRERTIRSMRHTFSFLLVPFLFLALNQDSARKSIPSDDQSVLPDLEGEYECVETDNPAGCTLPGVSTWLSITQDGDSVVLQTMQWNPGWNTVCQGEGTIVGDSIVITCTCNATYASAPYEWKPTIRIIAADSLKIINREYYAIWRRK